MFPRQSGKHVLGLIRQESGGTRQADKRDHDVMNCTRRAAGLFVPKPSRGEAY